MRKFTIFPKNQPEFFYRKLVPQFIRAFFSRSTLLNVKIRWYSNLGNWIKMDDNLWQHYFSILHVLYFLMQRSIIPFILIIHYPYLLRCELSTSLPGTRWFHESVVTKLRNSTFPRLFHVRPYPVCVATAWWEEDIKYFIKIKEWAHP